MDDSPDEYEYRILEKGGYMSQHDDWLLLVCLPMPDSVAAAQKIIRQEQRRDEERESKFHREFRIQRRPRSGWEDVPEE